MVPSSEGGTTISPHPLQEGRGRSLKGGGGVFWEKGGKGGTKTKRRENLTKRREIRKKRRDIPAKRREIRTFGAPPSFSFLGAPHLLYACSPLPSEASLRDPPGGKVVISRLLLRDGWSDTSEGGKRSTRDMRRTTVAYASRSCWSPVGCFPSAPSGGDVSR